MTQVARSDRCTASITSASQNGLRVTFVILVVVAVFPSTLFLLCVGVEVILQKITCCDSKQNWVLLFPYTPYCLGALRAQPPGIAWRSETRIAWR